MREIAKLKALRPYGFAIVLWVISCVIMYFGDAFLIRYAFPWALVSLLFVGAVASIWGARPATLILVLSALFGDLIVPDLHISYFYKHGMYMEVRLVRTLLFLCSGLAFVWLTHRARQIQANADRTRFVVDALQRMISPKQLSEVRGFEASGIYSPAQREEEVGGDFYDLFPISEGVYGVLIGDVVGKGKEAAAFTAMLRYSVRAFTSTGTRPALILDQLNVLIDSQKFALGTATLFIGILDVRSNTLQYASAGHEPPILCRADGGDEVLEATGPIIGAAFGFEYEESSVHLCPGDALLLITDGVSEARNSQRQFLNTEGATKMLWSALAAASSSSPEPSTDAVLQTMLQNVLEYIGENRRDDIAMLLLRRHTRPGQTGARSRMASRADHNIPEKRYAVSSGRVDKPD